LGASLPSKEFLALLLECMLCYLDKDMQLKGEWLKDIQFKIISIKPYLRASLCQSRVNNKLFQLKQEFSLANKASQHNLVSPLNKGTLAILRVTLKVDILPNKAIQQEDNNYHNKDIQLGVSKLISRVIPLEVSKVIPLEVSKVILLEVSKVIPLEVSKVIPLEVSKVIPLEVSKVIPLEVSRRLNRDILNHSQVILQADTNNLLDKESKEDCNNLNLLDTLKIHIQPNPYQTVCSNNKLSSSKFPLKITHFIYLVQVQ
jgi:hypothetical protein